MNGRMTVDTQASRRIIPIAVVIVVRSIPGLKANPLRIVMSIQAQNEFTAGWKHPDDISASLTNNNNNNNVLKSLSQL